MICMRLWIQCYTGIAYKYNNQYNKYLILGEILWVLWVVWWCLKKYVIIHIWVGIISPSESTNCHFSLFLLFVIMSSKCCYASCPFRADLPLWVEPSLCLSVPLCSFRVTISNLKKHSFFSFFLKMHPWYPSCQTMNVSFFYYFKFQFSVWEIEASLQFPTVDQPELLGNISVSLNMQSSPIML